MSTYYDTPKKPTPEIMEWIDSSWGIDVEAAEQAYKNASLNLHKEFSHYALQEVN